MAKTADGCAKILDAIVGHDDKDGTSHPDELCAKLKSGAPAKKVARVAVLGTMKKTVDADVAKKLSDFEAKLTENGIEVAEIEGEVFNAARVAWNILMTAELCNNVSRYDGIKYGYRAKSYTTIGELYTNSRTEAFGDLLKTAILYGSDRLSTENYMKIYDKSLRIRRVLVNAFAELFAQYDAVLMPVTSKLSYTEAEVEENKALSFEENLYTAPASITGLPSVVAGGVALVGPAFSENGLLDVARLLEKGGC
jgi:aspartyl-tRNA(Asn)/glutamyl-tRNA(Gln) amidotransferase subunit A